MRKFICLLILSLLLMPTGVSLEAEEISNNISIEFDKLQYEQDEVINVTFRLTNISDLAGIQIDIADNELFEVQTDDNPYIIDKGLFDSDSFDVLVNQQSSGLSTLVVVNNSIDKSISGTIYSFGIKFVAKVNIGNSDTILKITEDFDDITFNNYNISIKLANSEPNNILYSVTQSVKIPTVYLLGETLVSIDLGSDYTEMGCSYESQDTLIIDGLIDINKIGTYQISYYVLSPLGVKSEIIYREVLVLDNDKPLIDLPKSLDIEANNIAYDFFNYINSYITDNSGEFEFTYQSDILDFSEVGIYTVSVTATDSSGNFENDSFIVNIIDTTSPTFNIINQEIEEDTYELIDWTTYITDLSENSNGSLVYDVIDNVDYETPGTYQNTIRITDESGNFTEKTFSINVLDLILIYTVSFYKADGTTLINRVEVEENNTVSPIVYNEEGYTFNFWKKEGVEFDFSTIITSNIDLVADVTIVDNPTPPPTTGCLSSLFGSIYLDIGLMVVLLSGFVIIRRNTI